MSATKKANFLTIRCALQDNAGTRDLAAFNEFTYQITLMRPIPRPGRHAPNDFTPRPWADIDDTALAEHLNDRGFKSITTRMIYDVVNLLARDNPFHPVRDYLNDLEWDGTPRLSDFFIKHCSAVIHGNDDKERAQSRDYVAGVTRKFFISCVARVFVPGCQVDTMLILEGKQAKLKSSLLRTVAVRDEWFSDDPPVDLSTKDAKQYMNGIWICEMQELAPFRKSGPKAIKAFLTTRTDKYRPPYGRRDIHVPRQTVFVGTTNQGEYLQDMTGNRRFWPIAITRIDLAAINKIIDQIWAEAVAAYRKQESWWFTEALELVATGEQAARLEADPWLPLIAEHVETLNCVTTSAVLGDCLHVEKARRERPHQMRVGNILRALGFEKKRQRRGGDREYLYCRTEETAPAADAATTSAPPDADAAPPTPTSSQGGAGNGLDRDEATARGRCAQCNGATADAPMDEALGVHLHAQCRGFWLRDYHDAEQKE